MLDCDNWHLLLNTGRSLEGLTKLIKGPSLAMRGLTVFPFSFLVDPFITVFKLLLFIYLQVRVDVHSFLAAANTFHPSVSTGFLSFRKFPLYEPL